MVERNEIDGYRSRFIIYTSGDLFRHVTLPVSHSTPAELVIDPGVSFLLTVMKLCST